VPDVFTKRKRSEVMSRIRGHGNKETELALAKLFRQVGITGWRRQRRLQFTVHSSQFAVQGSRLNQTSFLPSNGWRSLWTAVSGTVAGGTAPMQKRGTATGD
jgi:hypothetical protein